MAVTTRGREGEKVTDVVDHADQGVVVDAVHELCQEPRRRGAAQQRLQQLPVDARSAIRLYVVSYS